MRIIFFNIWHGQVWSGMRDFLLSHSKDTDIFCFLEVDPKLEQKLESMLGEFSPLFDKAVKVDYLGGIFEGRSIFVKKGITVKNSGKRSLYHISRVDAGGFQFVELDIGGKKLFVGSVHGKARPGTKLDTGIRLNQSKKIIEFVRDVSGPKIIGGDFNLNPETESIRMFEEAGYRNLIKDFKVKSTRNNLAWEQFSKSDPNFVKQYFADYVFVSPGISVKNFEVPDIEISDHLPLVLDFEI